MKIDVVDLQAKYSDARAALETRGDVLENISKKLDALRRTDPDKILQFPFADVNRILDSALEESKALESAIEAYTTHVDSVRRRSQLLRRAATVVLGVSVGYLVISAILQKSDLNDAVLVLGLGAGVSIGNFALRVQLERRTAQFLQSMTSQITRSEQQLREILQMITQYGLDDSMADDQLHRW